MAVILIQIDEAHSDAWPIALKNQPPPQRTFDDRMKRAQSFVRNRKPPFPVYVDKWDNRFANLFRAWPDKFHCVDADLKVVAKAEFHKHGDDDAKIKKDYTDLLDELIDKRKEKI